ncbi:ShET2/EspL2 family type III secretion system effector toxin [Pseudomonas sp. SDO528_S397]
MPTIHSTSPPIATYTGPTCAPADDEAKPQPSLTSTPDKPTVSEPLRPTTLEDRKLKASQTQLSQVALTSSDTPPLESDTRARVQLNASSAKMGDLRGPNQGPSIRAKNQLYLPSKRESKNFNTQVNLHRDEIDAEPGTGSTTVACRHLAFEYFNTDKKANFLHTVRNEEAIKDYFSGGKLRSANQGIQHLVAAATDRNACVISADTLAFVVFEVGRKLKQRGESATDLMIVSSNHAMALSIQLKDRDRERVCVSFYDPNVTTNHFRVEGRGLDDLDALMQVGSPLAPYREAGSHAFTILAKEDFFKPEQLDVFLKSTRHSTRQQVLASSIHQALTRTDPTVLQKLVQTAVNEHPRGGPSLKAALAALDYGIPGMFRALQDGQIDSAVAYTKAVRSLVSKGLLSSNDLSELLKSDYSNGAFSASALYLPMSRGNTKTVGNYLDQVTDALASGELSKDHVKAQFSPHSMLNIQGLSSVWQRRDVKMLETVAQQLGKCHDRGLLDRNDIKEILSAQLPPTARGAALNNDPLAFARSKDVPPLKAALRPLVDRGALQKQDVKEILAQLGFVDTSLKTRFKNLLS